MGCCWWTDLHYPLQATGSTADSLTRLWQSVGIAFPDGPQANPKNCPTPACICIKALNPEPTRELKRAELSATGCRGWSHGARPKSQRLVRGSMRVEKGFNSSVSTLFRKASVYCMVKSFCCPFISLICETLTEQQGFGVQGVL